MKNKDTEKKEMLKLIQSLENPKENIKEFEEKNLNEEVINEEKSRLKELISRDTNADFKENYYVTGNYQTGGRGQTVNSIVPAYTEDAQSSPKSKSQPSELQPDEALEISIKRVLKSGAPINNISFYDEVNWNLMNLGFPQKNQLDIKTAILNMIRD